MIWLAWLLIINGIAHKAQPKRTIVYNGKQFKLVRDNRLIVMLSNNILARVPMEHGKWQNIEVFRANGIHISYGPESPVISRWAASGAFFCIGQNRFTCRSLYKDKSGNIIARYDVNSEPEDRLYQRVKFYPGSTDIRSILE
jgi:hypothetical protein